MQPLSVSTLIGPPMSAPPGKPSRPQDRSTAIPGWERLETAETSLVRDTTLATLGEYVHAVRNVLALALSRHTAEVGYYLSPKGRFRQMVHIRHLNSELEALHQDVRSGRRGSTLMERLDAVRGILVDLRL